MTDQPTPVPTSWIAGALSGRSIMALPFARYEAMHALCTAMAQWLANQQHWTELPDNHVVLESRATDGTTEYRITAGMIREASR